jgi:hypothetical protein
LVADEIFPYALAQKKFINYPGHPVNAYAGSNGDLAI